MKNKNIIKITEVIKKLKIKNKKIGLVHGVFDVLHIGHLIHFKEAKEKVDYLIASVTTDKFVNKAPGKPFFNIDQRIEMLKNLKILDLVIESDEETALSNIKLVKPNLYFKGNEYKNNDITGNILKEIKLVKKFNGKIFYTKGDVFSSSKILNEQFNFIPLEAKNFFKKLNIKELKKKIVKLKKNNLKISVYGDQIIDKYQYVKVSGKSNKSSTISAQSTTKNVYGGGSILVANFLTNFFNNISYIYPSNLNNNKFIKTFLDRSIKKISFNTENRFVEKNRFIEQYTNTKLFQSTANEDNFFSNDEIKKLAKKFIKITKNNKVNFIYDFGYYSVPDTILKIINNHQSKYIINCQSNSYNFGYNVATKYKKAFILAMDEQEYRLCTQDNRLELYKLIIKNKNKFKNVSELIITSGKYGCHIIKNNKIFFIPSIITNLKDTTGCGDIFLAMYGTLSLSKEFSVYEKGILSHIAAGLHGSSMGNNKINYTNFIKTCENILN